MPETTASLPMYDWPELRPATDAWWAGIARALRKEGLAGVPDRLTRGADLAALWGAPGLLVTQTCGYPLTHAWRGRLVPLVTPEYAADDCDGPMYRSLVVVRAEGDISGLGDLRGAVAAVNDRASQSGCAALRAVFAPVAGGGRFFSAVLETGSHLASMAAVGLGRAEVCAVDPVVWALAQRHRPELCAGLRPIARSPWSPGLPLATSAARPADEIARLRAGLCAAFADPGLEAVRAALLIRGTSRLSAADYEPIVELERTVCGARCPELA